MAKVEANKKISFELVEYERGKSNGLFSIRFWCHPIVFKMNKNR